MKTWLVTTETDPSQGITVEAETPNDAGAKAREKFPHPAVLVVREMVFNQSAAENEKVPDHTN